MIELERMKWQIYFSHLTERTNWMIHVMMKRRKLVSERIRVTKMTKYEANINKRGYELGEKAMFVFMLGK
jgi:hypothetical protein